MARDEERDKTTLKFKVTLKQFFTFYFYEAYSLYSTNTSHRQYLKKSKKYEHRSKQRNSRPIHATRSIFKCRLHVKLECDKIYKTIFFRSKLMLIKCLSLYYGRNDKCHNEILFLIKHLFTYNLKCTNSSPRQVLAIENYRKQAVET